MECNKTFLWFGVDFIALRYSTVIVILCNKNIDIYSTTFLAAQLVSHIEQSKFTFSFIWLYCLLCTSGFQGDGKLSNQQTK